MKKKNKSTKILTNYIKDQKLLFIVYIFLIFCKQIPGLINAYLFGVAVEYLINHQLNAFLTFLLIWSSINIVFYALNRVVRDIVYTKLQLLFRERITKQLYTKVNNLPAIAFEEMGVGELVNRLYNDPDRVMELTSKMINLVCKSIVVIFVIIVSFQISPLLGLLVLIFGIVMGSISAIFFPKIKKNEEAIKKETDQYVKKTTENITGIREIKALGIKNNTSNHLFKTVDKLINNAKKQEKSSYVYNVINDTVYYIFQFAILGLTGYFLVQGKIEYSIFAMLESFIWRIDEVVESISDFGISYNKVIVSLNRIDELINNKLYKDEQYGTKELNNPNGLIEFKNVTFHYRETEAYTLKNLNLTINPNQINAIVGRSGNGKSTIFNLLLRFFDANEGEILIDDVNIKDLTENSLRTTISAIRQSPFLFNASIKDNITIVKETATLEEIREVCNKAYIDDYIMSLPKQYDTIIGEGGINLSGGQKQRLAIARSLLINSKIILFDEATSALDNESQRYIKKTIKELSKDHTIIVIAHRLSTIKDADIINIIDKGTLIDSNIHKELLKTSTIYKNLYENETNE